MDGGVRTGTEGADAPSVGWASGPFGAVQAAAREMSRQAAMRARAVAAFAATRPAPTDRAQGERGAMSVERAVAELHAADFDRWLDELVRDAFGNAPPPGEPGWPPEADGWDIGGWHDPGEWLDAHDPDPPGCDAGEPLPPALDTPVVTAGDGWWAAGDALAALTAAADNQREDLAALLTATTGGGLADRPRIAVTGALLALTDLPELRRTGSCGAPACRRRIPTAGELDHLRAWPAGPTAAADLAGFCTTDHHGRHQAPGWTHTVAPEGTLAVTTPTGLTAVTDPPPY